MDWLLVAWFITGFQNGIDQHIVTTRTNTESACEAVLTAGHKYQMRGICVYDPVK